MNKEIFLMPRPFDIDPHPGRPKILFVGNSVSSHTHGWIDLLDGAELNVRLFALDDGVPPTDWPVRTYLTMPGSRVPRSSATRRSFTMVSAPVASVCGMWTKAAKVYGWSWPSWEGALASVIRRWQPDIVHTLGLKSTSFRYSTARERHALQAPAWIAQIRGGPELDLYAHLPEYQSPIRNVLTSCDQIIADNQQNYELLTTLGVPARRLSRLGVVPGSGGIDVAAFSKRWPALPSRRERLIVWPKAYECPASKALPVLEAFRLAWPRLRPCKIHLLWADSEEVRAWFAKLPQEIRESCTLSDVIPRAETLELYLRARVVLAPSLTDGIPNNLYEAMACGAFPIVSPIDTLRPLLRSPENTLFARNLYPEEIAHALQRAMSDDALVDAAVERNLDFVYDHADRAAIRPRVIAYYEDLAAGKVPRNMARWSTRPPSKPSLTTRGEAAK
jgi:glycosyltransferase involved in cell wall biosynthesis